MKVVLLENGDFTRLPPAPVAEYVEYGRQVDVLYQTALRWITMAPYLEYLKESRRRDIRGYYFLSQQEGLREKLRAYETQTPESRSELKTWLQMNCYISEASDELCEEEVQTAIEKNELVRFLEKYWARAKETYESFFQLQNPRDDVGWHSPLESRVKIRSDLSPDRKDFIKFNLEDGFRWNGWKLIVDFSSDARTRLWWQPGITPHADRLGGDNIYMDSDAPLSEWDTQWTIRHEYGHVLGLPDCYIEFYSVPEQAIVSYQIDVGDLMCSRAGKFNQRLFDELHKHYRNPLVAD